MSLGCRETEAAGRVRIGIHSRVYPQDGTSPRRRLGGDWLLVLPRGLGADCNGDRVCAEPPDGNESLLVSRRVEA